MKFQLLIILCVVLFSCQSKRKDIKKPEIVTKKDIFEIYQWLDEVSPLSYGVKEKPEKWITKNLSGYKSVKILSIPPYYYRLHRKESTSIIDPQAKRQIKNEELKYLFVFVNLEWLALSTKTINDKAIPYLKLMTQLKTLDLYRSAISEKGIEELQKALPNCKIYSPYDTE